jgi:sugar lactone lactonase YvrE
MTRTTCARLSRAVSALGLAATVACTGAGGDDDDDDDINTEILCELDPMNDGVSTLTGCPQAGMTDGVRGGTLFDDPVNVAVGPDGRVFVADFNNGRIRVVGDDGTTTTHTTQQGFRRPFGLAFAPDGTLYAQTDDNDDASGFHSTTTGTIWRVADDGTATLLAENLGRPRGMVVLADGRLVVADHMHHTVGIFDPTSRQLTVIAGALDQPGFADGPGASARFNGPYDVVDLGDGTVAVSDFANNRIRRIALATRAVTTLTGGAAGNADGALAAATFRNPQGLARGDDGSIYVTDTGNYVVRRIRDGQVTTVAGNGRPESADAADPRGAGIFGLEGIDVASDGTLYIADGDRGMGSGGQHRVRRAMVD